MTEPSFEYIVAGNYSFSVPSFLVLYFICTFLDDFLLHDTLYLFRIRHICDGLLRCACLLLFGRGLNFTRTYMRLHHAVQLVYTVPATPLQHRGEQNGQGLHAHGSTACRFSSLHRRSTITRRTRTHAVCTPHPRVPLCMRLRARYTASHPPAPMRARTYLL